MSEGDWDDLDDIAACLKSDPEARTRKSSHLMRHFSKRLKFGGPTKVKRAMLRGAKTRTAQHPRPITLASKG